MMTFAVRLVFLYGVLHSIANLWVVLPNEEIIDQGQGSHRYNEDNGTCQAMNYEFHQAYS